MFQPTHPVWGATVAGIPYGPRAGHFNPRTPCGVRHWTPDTRLWFINFNPRTPCGVRQDKPAAEDKPAQFQSTHPVWGATRMSGMDRAWASEFQSTHPVWGATGWACSSSKMMAEFQSTHPVWGATVPVGEGGGVSGISIHAPRVGCDDLGKDLVDGKDTISIHAPRVGCDRLPVCRSLVDLSFQSTHPVWGATFGLLFRPPSRSIFQSTHPVWGATVKAFHGIIRSIISIHAPRVGCDPISC